MNYSLWVRRYAPFAEFGGGFEGDHRTGPTTSMSATARTIGGCSFNATGVGAGYGASSGTSYTGAGPAVAVALGRHFSAVSCVVTGVTHMGSGVKFTLHSAGANPMAPGAPDIDTFVDMKAMFLPGAMTLEARVRGDGFPNAEVFVYDGVGKSVLLWDFTTSGDRNIGPLTMLSGSHSSLRLGSFFKVISLRPGGGFY